MRVFRPARSQWWYKADAGAITAEFAVALPTVLLVAALLLGLIRASMVSLSCQEAAASAARQVMLQSSAASGGGMGNDAAAASSSSGVNIASASSTKTGVTGIDPVAAAHAVAGADAAVQMHTAGNRVDVLVQCPIVPDPWGALPKFIEGKATALLQP